MRYLEINCLRRPMIPLDLDGYMFSDDWQRGFKDEVKSRLAADFKGWDSSNQIFENSCEAVVKAMRADEHARKNPPEPQL